MIQEFVAERGGGFLISGMIDEEFMGTPVEDLLPVTLVEEAFAIICAGASAEGVINREPFPRLTNNGEFSSLLRLSSDDERTACAGGNCRSYRGFS